MMNKKQSLQPKSMEPEFPEEILSITDVNFPGDETGNQISSLESYVKVIAELNQLNKGIIEDLIITTKDKLKNQLIEYLKIHAENKELIAPSGIALSLVVAIVTSECKSLLGIAAQTWEALLLFFLGASILWFFALLIRLINNRSKRNINLLIRKIKKREDL